MTDGSLSSIELGRKRPVLLLRSVVIATVTYLLVAGGVSTSEIVLILAYATSNVLLIFAPPRLFEKPEFGPLLVLADSVLILFGFSWNGGFSQDVLLVYFFTVFLVSVGESLGHIAVGSALIALLYGYWLVAVQREPLASQAWARLPFFFLIAIFYGSLTERLKYERRRRNAAERESRDLRALLDLATAFSETHATRQFALSVARFIEEACPGLRCEMILAEEVPNPERMLGTVFELKAHRKSYGWLIARGAGRRDVSPRERWLCQIVAHATAGALYAAEQSDAARVAADLKELFLSTVSHELRTPLHAILGYMEMLDSALAEESEDAHLRLCLERLRRNTCRLQDLIQQVLAFAEIRAGRRALHVEPVSMKELVEDLAPTVVDLIDGKPVTFSWQVAEGVGAIRTDRQRLRQVLACLLSNAAKFTEEGRVLLAIEGADDQIAMRISDTGIGISASDLKTAFDEFRQLDGSPTRRYGGLGLGLALAKELVMLLGGTMELQSEVGSGTYVEVRLPRVAPAISVHSEVVALREDQGPARARLTPVRSVA